jgi:hypothetical protein
VSDYNIDDLRELTQRLFNPAQPKVDYEPTFIHNLFNNR